MDAFLIKLALYKPKDGGSLSLVELPSFFHECNEMKEVLEYLNKDYRNIATVYIERLPEFPGD